MKVCIAAAAKMEELYIREWIDWNRSIGIDHIVIGDNNDSDYEHPLQPIIKDYIDEGYVEIIDLRDQLDVQVKFNNTVWNLYKDKYDWYAFLDIDEFVYCPNYSNKIKDLLNETESRGYNALVFPWLNMTSNKRIYYKDNPVQERFTTPSTETAVSVKYFLKYSPDIVRLGSRHCPCKVTTKNEYKVKDISTTFKEERFYYIKNNKGYKSYVVMERSDDHLMTGYIRHFPVKSIEEYVKYRMIRGCILTKAGKLSERYNFHYFRKHQNTDYAFIKTAYKYVREHQKEIDEAIRKMKEKISL